MNIEWFCYSVSDVRMN